MITVKNKQRRIAVDVPHLKKDAHTILHILKYEDFDLGIALVTNAVMQTYNRTYRKKDAPTDVLSFPYHEVTAGKRIKPISEDDKNLGDIVLAPAYIATQAKDLGISFEHQQRVLLVHGICHLLGYDHILDADFRVMRRKELAILRQI